MTLTWEIRCLEIHDSPSWKISSVISSKLHFFFIVVIWYFGASSKKQVFIECNYSTSTISSFFSNVISTYFFSDLANRVDSLGGCVAGVIISKVMVQLQAFFCHCWLTFDLKEARRRCGKKFLLGVLNLCKRKTLQVSNFLSFWVPGLTCR